MSLSKNRLDQLPALIEKAKQKWSNPHAEVFYPCVFCREADEYAYSINSCRYCLCDPDLCDKTGMAGLVKQYAREDDDEALVSDKPETQAAILALFDQMLKDYEESRRT